MLCKIADLTVEVPTAGGMAPRCRDYICDDKNGADITIRADLYQAAAWPSLSYEGMCYLESGWQFYSELLRFDGLMLHASAVELEGRAYLFSGPCGMGKSTHARLWQQTFGASAQLFNDDKPALRRLDNGWYAYGTPWCGKNGININMRAPLAGICFLKRGQENKIRRLSAQEAMKQFLPQTLYRFQKAEKLNLMLSLVDKLVREIPVFELENRPEPEAAQLSYETMRRAAEEKTQ